MRSIARSDHCRWVSTPKLDFVHFWRAFPSSCYAVPQVGEDAVRGTDQLGMTDLLRGETHELCHDDGDGIGERDAEQRTLRP